VHKYLSSLWPLIRSRLKDSKEYAMVYVSLYWVN
jgi:hypothetical protein